MSEIKNIDVIFDEVKERPLSDILNTITYKGESFIPIEYFEYDCKYEYFNDLNLKSYLTSCLGNETHEADIVKYLPYGLVIQLKKWGFKLNI